MRLSKLTEGITETEIVGETSEWDGEISALCIDGGQCRKDALFFCLTGGKSDGHAYAAQAVRNGARALVVERELPLAVPQVLVQNTRKALAQMSSRYFNDCHKRLKIVGITGTNGKTTTAHMLASILEGAGKKVGIIGTLGAKFCGETFDCDFTTPDPILLHELFAKMFAHGVEYVVMEVSAHALYYYKTDGVRFAACIFTNCTQDHLDFFVDMEGYKSAKKRLFSKAICPIAVLNVDDETGREWGKERLVEQGAEKTYFYGLNEPADAFAVITKEGIEGSACLLNIEDEICDVRLRLTGRHNVYNALAAATCAFALGVDGQSISKGLSALEGVSGRLERVASYRGGEIFVDFAHTPDGLEQSLSALKTHCRGRLICLFGCGGNRDKGKRPIMGKTVAKGCDFAVLTSDNPRYEDPLDILSEIEKGYREVSGKYVVVPDRRRALEYAIAYLQSGDVLLVAGKGGERYQEIMGIKYDFNDNAMIEKILNNAEKL